MGGLRLSLDCVFRSLPVWGEGIEMSVWHLNMFECQSLPVWGEGIEMIISPTRKSLTWSLPVWGEGIEISGILPRMQAT